MMASKQITPVYPSLEPLKITQIETIASGSSPYFGLNVATKKSAHGSEICFFDTRSFTLHYPPMESEGNSSTAIRIEKPGPEESSEHNVYIISHDILDNYYLQVLKKGEVKFTKKEKTFNQSQLFRLGSDPNNETKIALYTTITDEKGRKKTFSLRANYKDKMIIAGECVSNKYYYDFLFYAQTNSAWVAKNASQINALVNLNAQVGYFQLISGANYVLMNIFNDSLSLGAQPSPMKTTVIAKLEKVNTTGNGTYKIANVGAPGYYFRVTTSATTPGNYTVDLSSGSSQSNQFVLEANTTSGSNKVGFKTTLALSRTRSITVYLQPSRTSIVASTTSYHDFEVMYQSTNPISASIIGPSIKPPSLEQNTADSAVATAPNEMSDTALTVSIDVGVSESLEQNTITLRDKRLSEGLLTITSGNPLTAQEVLDLGRDRNVLFLVRFPTENADFAYLDTTASNLRYRALPNFPDSSILMSLQTAASGTSLGWNSFVLPESYLNLNGRSIGGSMSLNFSNAGVPTSWSVANSRANPPTNLSFQSTFAGSSYYINPINNQVMATSPGPLNTVQVLQVTSHDRTSFPPVTNNPAIDAGDENGPSEGD